MTVCTAVCTSGDACVNPSMGMPLVLPCGGGEVIKMGKLFHVGNRSLGPLLARTIIRRAQEFVRIRLEERFPNAFKTMKIHMHKLRKSSQNKCKR
jgi:hypothetical protein